MNDVFYYFTLVIKIGTVYFIILLLAYKNMHTLLFSCVAIFIEVSFLSWEGFFLSNINDTYCALLLLGMMNFFISLIEVMITFIEIQNLWNPTSPLMSHIFNWYSFEKNIFDSYLTREVLLFFTIYYFVKKNLLFTNIFVKILLIFIF